MSIQWRTILVLNLFVIGLAAVQGYIARDTAAQVVEERLAWQMSAGVSAFLQNRTYPLSDTMMAYFKNIFHTDWAVVGEDRKSFATSLAPDLSREFLSQLDTSRTPQWATLGGATFQVASQHLSHKDPMTGRPDPYRLYMLVPDVQLDAVRNRAAARMFTVFLPAAICATAVAVILSFTITRPLRRLVREMDTLAARAGVPAVGGSRSFGDALAPGKPLVSGATEIVRLAGAFHHLLKRLNVAQESLARSERLATLGKVCVSVAHEIRNPLSGIKMNVRVLQDELTDSPGRVGLDVILREIERMELYLQELMGAAEPPSTGASVSTAKVSELCDSVLTLLAGRCRHAHVRVTRTFPDTEPMIVADASCIRQCIMNLMVNAIEAMPGGGDLRVEVVPAGAQVRLHVGDTGAGVRCEPGTDVFEAFVSGKPNGVGLGLYLARQAVEANGGRIGYESTSAGSTFWIELPQATAGPAAHESADRNSRTEAVRS